MGRAVPRLHLCAACTSPSPVLFQNTANFRPLLAFLLTKFTGYQVLFCWDGFPGLKGNVALPKCENSEFCPCPPIAVLLGDKKSSQSVFMFSFSSILFNIVSQ